ncbi:MAG: hypothetical protein HY716_01115 [Planctomycetes bacterium]|nr:hypothetical protein [Planctomycetota bacterium]
MKPIFVILGAALLVEGCASSGGSAEPNGGGIRAVSQKPWDAAPEREDLPMVEERVPIQDPNEARDWGDLDRFAGQRVELTGTFDHIQGRLGVLTLRHGLVLYLPHFDLFKRGDDWFRYVGQQVRVGGVLHNYRLAGSGHEGPSVAVDFFEALEAP